MTWAHRWGPPGNYSFPKDFHRVVFDADDGIFAGELIFQDGPVQEHGCNGTTNEEVIQVLIERIEALNQPPYQSGYNDRALANLRSALRELEARTKSRQQRSVEGTSTP